MAKLREFHQSKLKWSILSIHLNKLSFIQSLWNGQASYYKDHAETQKKILGPKELCKNIKQNQY